MVMALSSSMTTGTQMMPFLIWTERICKGVEFVLNLQETQGTVAESEVVALDEEVVMEDVEILQGLKLTIGW